MPRSNYAESLIGAAVGTDVRLAGIKVGSVSGLTLDPKTYLVTVHMDVRNDIKLPVDSSILVTQAGFLGGQYLSITPGGDNKMMAAGGFFENAQGSIDLMMMALLGGRERTARDWLGLLRAAGLELGRQIPTASEFTISEATIV